jgi:hypothetical protein
MDRIEDILKSMQAEIDAIRFVDGDMDAASFSAETGLLMTPNAGLTIIAQLSALAAERDRLRGELAAAQDHIDLMVDEFKRIKSRTLETHESLTEIQGICDRAISNTYQHISVIKQRKG